MDTKEEEIIKHSQNGAGPKAKTDGHQSCESSRHLAVFAVVLWVSLPACLSSAGETAHSMYPALPDAELETRGSIQDSSLRRGYATAACTTHSQVTDGHGRGHEVKWPNAEMIRVPTSTRGGEQVDWRGIEWSEN